MAQRRSLVNFCWINGHFNEYMQTGSVWGRKMNPGIQELLVQRERQVVNDSIHLQDQLNWGLIGRSRKGLSWRQNKEWLVPTGMGKDKVDLAEEMTFNLALNDNWFSRAGKVPKHDKLQLCLCISGPLVWYLSSQGRRIILELEIRGPELATTACPWDVCSLLWISVYM